MYQPNYAITDKLLANIVSIEVLRNSLNIATLGYNTRNKLSLNTKAANLFHLAHMLSVNITLKDAEKLAEGRNLEIEPHKQRLITNFRNVLEFNRSNVAEGYVNLDPAVILHLNKIILTGWKEAWEVKIRTSGEAADTMFDEWQTFADRTVTPELVEPMFVDLLDWHQDASVRVNPLIRIPILIFRMMELMPFLAGNKLTIISLADLLLHQHGYLASIQAPILKIFDTHQQEHWKLWEACQRGQDLTPWLEKFTENLKAEMQNTRAEVDQLITEETEKNTSQPFLNLNKRQLKALRYLQNIPTVKREDYCQMMEVSTMTAFRDLNDLVRKRLLKVEGQGRGTKYMLVSR